MKKIMVVVINCLFIALLIASSAFDGNAEEGETKKPSACLYYASQNKVSKFCFPGKKESLIYAIPKHVLPKEMSSIKIRLGKMVWMPGEKTLTVFGIPAYGEGDLYTWDGTNTHRIKLEKYQTATSVGGVTGANKEAELFFSDIYINNFLISPDSEQIAWNINRLTKVIDDVNGGTSFVSHDVKVASLAGQNKKNVLKEQFTAGEIFADHFENRQLLYWSKSNPDRIFLNTYFDSQLEYGSKHLYALDLKNKRINPINKKIEKVIGFSSDERMIASTTCCEGDTDYPYIGVTITDLSSGKLRIIDDRSYGNDNAIFSPSDDLIAITSNGITIRKVDTGEEITKINKAHVIGWIDNDHLLIGRKFKNMKGKDFKYGELFIYDLKSAKEEMLSLKNVIAIGMETY
ncbi:MAG: hypothetical protein WC855_06805 [Thermodesulfovibrionales bacterium]